MPYQNLSRALTCKADMQISNYGKATPIDQAQLKRAKTWAEANKGSMLEQGDWQLLGKTRPVWHSGARCTALYFVSG